MAWTATVTPFEVCFLTSSGSGVLFFTNCIIDSGFWLDMILNFRFFAYYEKNTTKLVTNSAKIAKRYAKSWLLPDFVSTFPFDAVVLAGGGGGAESLKMLQLVRLIRLTKLLRLLRGMRVVKIFLANCHLSFTTQSLISLLAFFLLFVHLLACVFGLIAKMSAGDNWIMSIPDSDGTQQSQDAVAAWDVYREAMNFGLKLVKCYVLPTATPLTSAERGFATVGSVLCTLVYTFLLGRIVAILTMEDPAKKHFQTTFDSMCQYMASINVPEAQQKRVRNYLFRSKDMLASRFYTRGTGILHSLSPGLQGEIAEYTVGHALRNVGIFNPQTPGIEHEVEQELRQVIPLAAMVVDSMAFAEKEIIYPKEATINHCYIIESGLVGHGTAIHSKGVAFGQEFVSNRARTHSPAIALTHVFCLTLGRVQLMQIVQPNTFPRIYHNLRRYQIRMVLRHSMRTLVEILRADGEIPPKGKSSTVDTHTLHALMAVT
jgi:hypothetical protein